jgi:hypothetical protein
VLEGRSTAPERRARTADPATHPFREEWRSALKQEKDGQKKPRVGATVGRLCTVLCAGACVLASAHLGLGATRPNLLIRSAPAGTGPTIGLNDIRPTLIHVTSTVDGAGVVLPFNARGRSAFERLTRALARLGAKRHSMEYVVVELDGVIYERTAIDYHAYPDGIHGSPNIEIVVTGPSATGDRASRDKTARDIAAKIKAALT